MVDDDEGLCELVREFLGREGYESPRYMTAHRDWVRALEGSFALVILDVMLPVLDGFAVLRQLRRQSTVPVIMLTARASEQDRVGGLGEGADDYLVKPFAAGRAPRQNPRRPASNAETSRNWRPAWSRSAICGSMRPTVPCRSADVPIELTPTEFTILEVLMRSVGRIVSRDELSGVLYQRQTTPYERSLDVHVSHLRRKLEGVGWTAIRTVRGQGYICVTDA